MILTISKIHQHFLDHYKFSVDQHLSNQGPGFISSNYNITSFLQELMDSGSSMDLGYLSSAQDKEGVLEILVNAQVPVVMFLKEDNTSIPVLIKPEGQKLHLKKYNNLAQQEDIEIQSHEFELYSWVLHKDLYPAESNQVGVRYLLITCFPLYQTNATEDHAHTNNHAVSPWKRLWNLLHSERQEVLYIYFYSILGSILGLSLPLGVQAIIGLVSSGEIPTSILVLIGIIVSGLLFTGAIQLMQIKLVEHIQQKIFAKTAFEFAYRIPKLYIESVIRQYTPELMNRFFDIITLQKGLSKLLVDFTTVIVQIILGILLLSLYHSAFLFFGILLISLLYILIRSTAHKAFYTSLKESKYKYMVANWLEEIARALSTFKLAGYSPLPLGKTDQLVGHYLYARKAHFKILIVQYVSFILFKTFITGGLLILGCVLVVNEEINIGQFVASEIVIILVMNAVEKLIVQLDTIYDLLTSLEKIGGVMDLPIETAAGMNMSSINNAKGMAIEVKNLKYKYPSEPNYILKGIDLDIQAGERICITGYSSSGKTTFINILLGFLSRFEGMVAINGVSMKLINRNSFIDHVGDNISQEDLFDGTLLENITLGRSGITMADIEWATSNTGLSDYIQSQALGLNTYLPAGNLTISESIAHKIILARSIVKRPKLLVLEDFLLGFENEQKVKFLKTIFHESNSWTVLLVSNDPEIMRLCDRTIVLKHGSISSIVTNDDFENRDDISELIK
jgi:ABC-type bacteriocin/lantibiotic exporter with double-glycine peptidase domain